MPLVYEINTRCWLRELSDRRGEPVTLANVPESEFAVWRGFGFTHVWLMGVWESGPRAREQALYSGEQRAAYARALLDFKDEDVGGSPYAIGDYHVLAALGGDEGLSEFRHRLKDAGIKLILDFVPNHIGLDHPWIREKPQVLVQVPAGIPESFACETVKGKLWFAHGKDPNFAAWRDTAQLDYRRSATREAIIGLLESIAQRCDGVRCDMAMLLLNEVFERTWRAYPIDEPRPSTEFWAEAISRARRLNPDFLFLAEAYWGLEPELQGLGFDFTYDKGLYDALVSRNAVGVQRHLLELGPARLAKGAYFLENHDEPRVASLLSVEEHRAAALVVLALPGLRLLHEGQLTGARRQIPVQLLRRPGEAEDPEILTMYEQLLGAVSRSVVGQGTGTLLAPRAAWSGNLTAQNFVVVQWQSDPLEFDLVVVNLAEHRSQCRVPVVLPDGTMGEWTLTDRLGQERYRRSGSEMQREGLYLDVAEHGAQLFRFEAMS